MSQSTHLANIIRMSIFTWAFHLQGRKVILGFGSFIKEAMIKNASLPIILLIILKQAQGLFIYFMSYIYKVHKTST